MEIIRHFIWKMIQKIEIIHIEMMEENFDIFL